MATKYQRALKELKQGRTWQQVADKLGDALGETVHRSDPWNVMNHKSSSRKVEAALEQMGLIPGPKPRYRLAMEFDCKEDREDFRDYYGINNKEITFTDWALSIWRWDDMLDGE